MTIVKHNAKNTFAVLKPDMSVDSVVVSPSIYADLDKKYQNFQGHSLMAVYEFSSSWNNWERHPAGDEIVMLLSGQATMAVRVDGQEEEIRMSTPGSYVVIPKGAWHTAYVNEPTRMLFLTPGEGTEHTDRL